MPTPENVKAVERALEDFTQSSKLPAQGKPKPLNDVVEGKSFAPMSARTVRELHADLAEVLTEAQMILSEIHKRMG